MKKKILLGYNYILHYRKPLFNLLAERYDLVVLHSGSETVEDNDLYTEIIYPSKKIGPFYIQRGIVEEVKKEKYDYIILLFDLRWINTLFSMYTYNKKSKLILWGAWMTNSMIANKARLYLTKKVNASIFYTQASRLDFIDAGINPEATFVANNTFDVGDRVKSFLNPVKNKILFVGSLDERKQNDVLIEAYSNIICKISDNIELTLVGEGIDMSRLKKIVKEKGIDNKVNFVGKIVDTKVLQNYYKEAIVSVSFGQAGLSVLQSLGYGVPFLTKGNAISGGEKTNIKNRLNSVFCEDSIVSLEKSLLELCNDLNYARNLGKNAYDYYSVYCTIENMNQGFLDAIENTNLSIVDKS